MSGYEIASIVCFLILFSLLVVMIIFIVIQSKKNKHTEIDEKCIDNKIELIITRELLKIKDDMNNSFNSFKDSINKTMNELLEKTKDNGNKQEQSIRDFTDQAKKGINESYATLLSAINNQLDKITNNVNNSLNKGFEDNKNSLIKVSESLGKISEAQKNLDSLSSEVTTLNNVLTNSQKRGRYGEVVLETLLSEVFGETHGLYDTQYKIPNKEVRPDAVVFIDKDQILCIDSKFSFVSYEKLLEQKNIDDNLLKDFKKALKGEIDKIKEDYIIENLTTNYAVMFIPNDGIYAFIQSNDTLYNDVVCYARRQNVIITSPSTLQPVLATILTMHINKEIANNIKDVVKEINVLSKLNANFSERWEKVSKSIDSLCDKKNELNTTVKKITNKTNSIIKQATKDELISPNELQIEDSQEIED